MIKAKNFQKIPGNFPKKPEISRKFPEIFPKNRKFPENSLKTLIFATELCSADGGREVRLRRQRDISQKFFIEGILAIPPLTPLMIIDRHTHFIE